MTTGRINQVNKKMCYLPHFCERTHFVLAAPLGQTDQWHGDARTQSRERFTSLKGTLRYPDRCFVPRYFSKHQR